MVSPLQHPKVIEHWRWARWAVGLIAPAVFATSTYLTVHGPGPKVAATMAALAVGTVVFFLEHGYVLHTGGKSAEILGQLGDVACLVVPWMPLVGVLPTVLLWFIGSVAALVATGTGRWDFRPLYVILGTPVSAALAWGTSHVLAWASRLSAPGVPSVGISVSGWALRLLLAVAAACAIYGAYWWGLRWSAGRRIPLPRELRGDDLDEFLSLVKLKTRDGPSPIPGHEDPTRMQTLYGLPHIYGDVRLLVTHNGTKNPATDQYEAVGLRATLACDTANDAAGETYGQDGAEYALTERRT